MKEKLQLFLAWVLDRLGEQSTWKGIMGFATAAGVMLKPDQWDKIIAFGFASTALINVFRNEKKQAEAHIQTAIDTGVVSPGPTVATTKANI